MISFVRTDRECSPLRTAPRGLGQGPVFARSDRSHGLRSIGTDERLVIGRGKRLAPARRPGAVRTDEHEPRPDEGAVARHEQLRSYPTNKTTRIRASFSSCLCPSFTASARPCWHRLSARHLRLRVALQAEP